MQSSSISEMAPIGGESRGELSETAPFGGEASLLGGADTWPEYRYGAAAAGSAGAPCTSMESCDLPLAMTKEPILPRTPPPPNF